MSISNTLKTLGPILGQHHHGFEILKALAYWDRHAEHYEHETEGPLNVDIAEAVYWIGNDWHGGQSCPLYSALCMCGYEPGPISRGPEKDTAAEMIYQELDQILALVE